MRDVASPVDSEVGRLSQALVQSQQEAGDAEASRRESEMERQQGHERRRELEGLLAKLREEAQLKQEQTEQGEPMGKRI